MGRDFSCGKPEIKCLRERFSFNQNEIFCQIHSYQLYQTLVKTQAELDVRAAIPR